VVKTIAYKCQFCGTISLDPDQIMQHENQCLHSPLLKGCITCAHRYSITLKSPSGDLARAFKHLGRSVVLKMLRKFKGVNYCSQQILSINETMHKQITNYCPLWCWNQYKVSDSKAVVEYQKYGDITWEK